MCEYDMQFLMTLLPDKDVEDLFFGPTDQKAIGRVDRVEKRSSGPDLEVDGN